MAGQESSGVSQMGIKGTQQYGGAKDLPKETCVIKYGNDLRAGKGK